MGSSETQSRAEQNCLQAGLGEGTGMEKNTNRAKLSEWGKTSLEGYFFWPVVIMNEIWIF